MQRQIVIEVEADNLESAIEEQAAKDAPSFSDPRWETEWDLMNEEIFGVGDGE